MNLALGISCQHDFSKLDCCLMLFLNSLLFVEGEGFRTHSFFRSYSGLLSLGAV